MFFNFFPIVFNSFSTLVSFCLITSGSVVEAFFSDDGQRSLRYAPFYANSGFYYLLGTFFKFFALPLSFFYLLDFFFAEICRLLYFRFSHSFSLFYIFFLPLSLSDCPCCSECDSLDTSLFTLSILAYSFPSLFLQLLYALSHRFHSFFKSIKLISYSFSFLPLLQPTRGPLILLGPS